MLERPTVTPLTAAKVIHKIHCGKCNWEQEIIAGANAEVVCCPWCGWNNFDISKVTSEGGFQEIQCQKHGKVTILLPSPNIQPLDFMDNLFCPFCE